jgi:hypothetical protein
VGYKLLNKGRILVFKLKESNSYALCEFVIAIVILPLIAIVVANIFIINIISVSRACFIIVLRVVYNIIS